jgi:NAD+ diphosphatase
VSVPPGGSTPADNPPPDPAAAWLEGTSGARSDVPVLSRVAHDRAHLARSRPDPTDGRAVRVLTVDGNRTVPVHDGAGGLRLIWDERPELPAGAVYLGEADGVPYAAVRGERALTVNGRPACAMSERISVTWTPVCSPRPSASWSGTSGTGSAR